MISYIVYIKEQTEQDPSLVNLEELGRSAILKTNKGMQNPSEVPIHFTPEYKNSINLQGILPGRAQRENLKRDLHYILLLKRLSFKE